MEIPFLEAYCSAAVDAMLGMQSEIVPELAWQMGRPVRYGAGELRGFEERARYMISIAEKGLHRIDPRTVELRKMYLRAGYRGKGLGTRLLDHALSAARREAVTHPDAACSTRSVEGISVL